MERFGAGDRRFWLDASAGALTSPLQAGVRTGGIVLHVANVDAHYERTRSAGATILGPPTDQDYGQREYGLRDPEGHDWYIATPCRVTVRLAHTCGCFRRTAGNYRGAGPARRGVAVVPSPPTGSFASCTTARSAAWGRRRDEPEHRELVERTADLLANVVAPPWPGNRPGLRTGRARPCTGAARLRRRRCRRVDWR